MFKKQSIWKSFLNALRGFVLAVKSERNLKIALLCIPPVLVYSAYVRLSRLEIAAVIMCIFAVIISELINTAVENTIDAVIKEYDENAGKAKDTAAAVTLTASAGAAVVGFVVMYRADKTLSFFANPVILAALIIYFALAVILIKTGGKDGQL